MLKSGMFSVMPTYFLMPLFYNYSDIYSKAQKALPFMEVETAEKEVRHTKCSKNIVLVHLVCSQG